MRETALALIAEGGWPRERLDADYNARATVGDRFAEEMNAYRRASDAARAASLSHADILYDAQSGQTIDLFGTDLAGTPRPVFVFVHGGYWRALSKSDSAMMAGMLANEGVATAVVDYQLAPGASLGEIVREIRAAIAFLWREGARYGIDPTRIHVGGSSAGGHLAGMLIASGWHGAFDVPPDVVKSALLLNGLLELAPLAACFPQEWLSLDAEAVAALSPIRHLPANGCPIVIAWAEGEAPGFKRQSTAFFDVWSAAGFAATAFEAPGRNHFDLLMDLSDRKTELSEALLRLVRAPTN